MFGTPLLVTTLFADPELKAQMDPMDTRMEQMTVARNLSSSSAPGTAGGPVRPGQASL